MDLNNSIYNMIEFTLTLYYECSEQLSYAAKFNLVETENYGEYMGIYHIRDTQDNVNEWIEKQKQGQYSNENNKFIEKQKSGQYSDENNKFIVNCKSINDMVDDSQLIYSYCEYDDREWVKKIVTFSNWVDENANCLTIDEFDYIFDY